MSEEKNEERDFLSGHEELLSNLKKKDIPEESEEEAAEASSEPQEAKPVEETPEPVEEKPEPEPAEEIKPVIEEVPKEEPIMEQHPVDAIPEVIKETPAPKPKPVPKKKPKPTPAQKHQNLEKAEVKEVLAFMQKYVKPAAIGLLIVCAFVLTNSFFKNTRLKKEAAADAALLEARNAADYQAILENYGKTPSAPIALMGLAQEKFNAGQAAEAEALYSEFLQKHKKHEMVFQAEFNLITCKEAQQQFGDAIILYGDFKVAHPESHLAPVALLGKARCLEALDNFSEAKQVYEDIITFHPQSGWSRIAESNLAVVESKLK